ncbi:5-(carboxyamino)imidazole ribonucleotide synthase [Leptolyngbya sp. FACHB-8]|uniref:5-(carboxyamino)imidazole ribonucleotide synthase n=1 Tax=unclassified Leptolyngbya TaxID=2650499 RepID=UPI00168428E4|nr:5-(carboxyamino)imidazole ribonucleotide synthase [Leptolyngbya sp. FACHB-8]MBD1910538.1 5-(carboxyamino)imidazole ribonucleotide synthase [Leptolyngbya sp. FACHB-8]
MAKRIGVIGGGQLAWMMAPGAAQLGLELVIQTPGQADPAVAIAQGVVTGAIADASATATLAQQCDVITFENEFVDLPALQKLADQGVTFYPPLSAIQPILDKYDQRSALQSWGVPTPKFAVVSEQSDDATLSQFGFPVVLKARRHGYDGQGTFVLKDLATLQEKLKDAAPDHWLLEEFVPFEQELAIMAARSHTGDVVIYPLVETQQVDQVCRRVYVTQEWGGDIDTQARAIAQTILEQLNYVGVLGIELFLPANGQLSVNELAPRTHNSGHYTLDACETSQFEQQLRAVSGLALGSPALHNAGAVMVNLLGFESSESDYSTQRAQLAEIPHAHVYWYGKTQSRRGRKLGHVTVVLQEGQGRQEAEAIAQQIEQLWYPS